MADTLPDGTEHDPRADPPPALVDAAERLVRERLRFSIPVAVLGLGAFIVISALAGFTDALAPPVIAPMSLNLLLLMLLVPYVWVLALLYRRRADRWDARAAEIRATTWWEDRP